MLATVDNFFIIVSDSVHSVRFKCNSCEPDTACETEIRYAKLERKALRVIPRGKHRLTVYRAHQVDHKNEDISKSVSSIDSGAIFQTRRGQYLSRNAFVVSVYAL